jgi:hypothetical protein
VFRANGIEATVYAAVSEPEHVQLTEEFGGIPLEVPNLPLGNKWNTVMSRAHKEAADYLFIVGSDDFFASSLIERYIPFMKDGHPYIGIEGMYFCEPSSRRALHFPAYPIEHKLWGQPVGSGRMIRRGLLPPRPWAWFADIGLDGDITVQLWNHHRVLLPVSCDGPAVDVKTGTNMWSYDKLQQSYKGAPLASVAIEDVLRALPEGEEIMQTFGA